MILVSNPDHNVKECGGRGESCRTHSNFTDKETELREVKYAESYRILMADLRQEAKCHIL